MDLTFETANGILNYRVGAVIRHKGKLLLMRNTRDAYSYTVGGRVHLGESAEDAVVREVREELAIEMEIDHPLCFHQDFFNSRSTGQAIHEIAIYFLMKDTPDLERIHCESVTAAGASETPIWAAPEELDELDVVPVTLVPLLKELPENMTIITQDDR